MAIKVYSLAKDGSKKLSANFAVREFRCKDGSDPIFIDSFMERLRTSGLQACRWTRWPPTPKRCCLTGAVSVGIIAITLCMSMYAQRRAAGPGKGVIPMASVLMPDAPYASWLSGVLTTLEEHKIDRIAVAAPLPNGEVFTGYFRLDTMDKALLAANMQADAVLDAVCHNGQRIQQAWSDDIDEEV